MSVRGFYDVFIITKQKLLHGYCKEGQTEVFFSIPIKKNEMADQFCWFNKQ